MTDAIREMAPFAVGIAISPVPVVAVVLMLISDGGRSNAVMFLVGWAVTLALVCGGVAVLGLGEGSSGGGRGVAIAQLVLAAVLVVLIVVEWRGRPGRGEPVQAPRWMTMLTDISPGRALGLGVVLVVLNAKDAGLAVAAGAKLAHAELAVPAAAVAVLVFVLVASLTVIVPLVVELALGERAVPILHRWHGWLERHGSTAVIVTLVVVVIVLVAQALSSL